MWASAKVPAATTPSATTLASRRWARGDGHARLEGARIVGPCGPTGTSRASRGRSIGVRARQTTDPSSSSSSSADDLTPEFVKNARTRRPKVADVIRNPKKFVADVGASIPTGTSRIIDEKVRDVVIPVNALDPLYREYTSEQLRAKTDEFRARLKKGDTLDDLRVEAFAVVREAARRELNMRHFDVQDRGRRAAARGEHLRDGDG